jgi:hypothetical protein
MELALGDHNANAMTSALPRATMWSMRTVLLATLLTLLCFSALAQPNLPACNGEFTVVRVSQIKPGGSIDGFMKAVAAQQEWYRSHGFKDNRIVAVRVLEPDPFTGEVRYSEKTVLTYHYNPPGMGNPAGRGDDAWNAYVKLYRDNSDIQSEYVTCMPKSQP